MHGRALPNTREWRDAILMMHLPKCCAQNSHHTNATYKRTSNPGPTGVWAEDSLWFTSLLRTN